MKTFKVQYTRGSWYSLDQCDYITGNDLRKYFLRDVSMRGIKYLCQQSFTVEVTTKIIEDENAD